MENKKQTIYKKWWFWCIIILIVAVIGNISNDSNTTMTDSNLENVEKVIFLKNSDGKEFYNILCEIAEITPEEPQNLGETLLYECSNSQYSIEVETNKNSNEINYLRLMTFKKSEFQNFFAAVSRLEYDGHNKNESFNWIINNLGKEATTKIGDANLKLSLSINNTPILEIYTDGNEEYQNKLIDTLL